jgi:hypothetical protein
LVGYVHDRRPECWAKASNPLFSNNLADQFGVGDANIATVVVPTMSRRAAPAGAGMPHNLCPDTDPMRYISYHYLKKVTYDLKVRN